MTEDDRPRPGEPCVTCHEEMAGVRDFYGPGRDLRLCPKLAGYQDQLGPALDMGPEEWPCRREGVPDPAPHELTVAKLLAVSTDEDDDGGEA